MQAYSPANLHKWTLPDSYFGARWDNYYSSSVGQSRDSDALERSNFRCMLKALGGESETVLVVHEGHWAVGWVEWIAIHESDSTSLQVADEIAAALADYPLIDDNDHGELEQEDADETWKNCFDALGRIAYIRDHRSQFEFRDYADMIGCVRGKYFAGYASELLY